MSYTDEEGIVYFCATGPKVIATVGPTGFLQSLIVVMSKVNFGPNHAVGRSEHLSSALLCPLHNAAAQMSLNGGIKFRIGGFTKKSTSA